ncbi:MAG TPA: serine/threonine-protein kinase [Polyangiaceae bacterium]|nr:serine/threonine-protein kinase [Polyangiaceae bacterium]
MTCLDENTVLELLERRVTPARRSEIHEHLDACRACRTLVAGSLEVLSHEQHQDEDELTVWVERSDDEADDQHWPIIEPGTMVDHYRIVRRLGSGGMGQVYLALDTLLERKVALKMVHQSLMERGRALERFLVEARTTAKLNHPNIVTIHAVGSHGSTPYVALELLSGQTLRERLRHEQLPAEASARVMLAVARALDAAHAAGVCHGDLKPANVMLCYDTRVCVLDFGLAKIVDRDETTWVEGVPSSVEPENLGATSTMVGGTPAYMAPEQWRGELQSASDIWALGVMLYEAASGRRPFDAPPAASRPQRLFEMLRVVTSSSKAPTLDKSPEAYAALVARCLQKDPARRPSAREVVDALAAMFAEEPPLSRRPAPRRRLLPLLVAASALAAVTVAAVLPRNALLVHSNLAPTITVSPPPLVPAARNTAHTPAPAASSASPKPPPSRWDPLSYR